MNDEKKQLSKIEEEVEERTYTPPAIEEEEVFDTMALGCTRASAAKGCQGTLAQ